MKAKFTGITLSDTVRRVSEANVYSESDDPRYLEWDVIGIYPGFEYQTFEGFGTALTDSACYLLSQMSPDEKKKTLECWFGKKGVDARFIRVSIDSCDYSLEEYQAVSDPLSDPGLTTFSIGRDKKRIIPFIKEAIALSGERISVMLSPWSPPYQWKTTQMKTGTQGVPDESKGVSSRNFGGSLKPEYYGAWAKYIVKYVNAYLDDGIPVSMLTLQNESYAITDWDSCYWTAEAQKVFLRDHLYPEMEKAGLADKVKILVWDYNKDHLLDNLEGVVDGDTRSMIDGVAFHWYTGDHFDVLRMVREKYPDLLMIHSESCILKIPDGSTDRLDARRYAHDIIGDLNNGAQGYIDWNVTVDRRGGPRHVPGGFSAPLVTEDDFTLTKTPSYEYMRLIAETAVPGSKIIGSSSCRNYLETFAVRRPDGSIGVIIMSTSDKTRNIHLICSDRVIDLVIKPDSLNSIIF